MWHEFMKPPYGGGNQFLLGLSKALTKKGISVVQNEISDDVDVYLLNSVHFEC